MLLGLIAVLAVALVWVVSGTLEPRIVHVDAWLKIVRREPIDTVT